MSAKTRLVSGGIDSVCAEFRRRNVPFASRRAENYLRRAIEVAQEIGAKAALGMAYLDLGLVYKAKRRRDRAKEYISTAIQCFQQCEAVLYLKQAKEAMKSLGVDNH